MRAAALPAALAGASLLALALGALTGCGPREPLPPASAYGRYCDRCHGDDGRGDPKAVRLNPRLDLVRSLMVGQGDAELIRERIAEGHGAMPGFERKLSAEEIDDLSAYTIERFAGAGER